MRYTEKLSVLRTILISFFCVGAVLIACSGAFPQSSTSCDRPVVVIDPGHGTRNSRVGAVGEARFNMLIGNQLYTRLKESNVNAILTHDHIGQDLGASDAEQDNRIRAELANKSHAIIVLRLHCDAPGGRPGIYYPALHPDHVLAEKSKSAAELIAQEMNSLDVPGGPFAIKGDESTSVGHSNHGLLTGSKLSEFPVVLVEMAALDRKGTAWLGDTQNQRRLVDALSRALMAIIRRSTTCV